MPFDRRKYLRHEVKLPAELSADAAEYYAVEIQNLSLYGMQLEAEAWLIQKAIPDAKRVTPMQPHECRLKFALKFKDKHIEQLLLDCNIISVSRRSQTRYLLSLRYHNLDNTTTTLLESFIT